MHQPAQRRGAGQQARARARIPACAARRRAGNRCPRRAQARRSPAARDGSLPPGAASISAAAPVARHCSSRSATTVRPSAIGTSAIDEVCIARPSYCTHSSSSLPQPAVSPAPRPTRRDADHSARTKTPPARPAAASGRSSARTCAARPNRANCRRSHEDTKTRSRAKRLDLRARRRSSGWPARRRRWYRCIGADTSLRGCKTRRPSWRRSAPIRRATASAARRSCRRAAPGRTPAPILAPAQALYPRPISLVGEGARGEGAASQRHQLTAAQHSQRQNNPACRVERNAEP